MEARLIKTALLLSTFTSLGATYRTDNFVVHAPSREIAEKVGKTAEFYRDELARQWLGKTFRNWAEPCPIRVKVGRIGAGGATSFSFDRGHVFGWRMNVQGSLERILDSVVPHEVSHTIFATHFRRPLPRWADEGAATLIEHESERRRQLMMLKQVWNTRRRIPLRKLMSMTEYPRDMRSVMALYAEGYSLADYLVQKGGRAKYLQFLDDAHRRGWNAALRRHYEFSGIDALEQKWSGWVMAGSPRLDLPEGHQLADADDSGAPPRPVIRSQSPDRGARAEEQADTRPRHRGRDLQAPAPAGRKRALAAASASPGSDGRPPGPSVEKDTGTNPRRSEGRTIAINDGWEPVTEPRKPRPAPLAVRIPFQRPREMTQRKPALNHEPTSP